MFLFNFREFNYLIQCSESVNTTKIEKSFNERKKEFKYITEENFIFLNSSEPYD